MTTSNYTIGGAPVSKRFAFILLNYDYQAGEGGLLTPITDVGRRALIADRKPLAYPRNARVTNCLDCDTDITHRGGTAKRCEECQKERKRMLDKRALERRNRQKTDRLCADCNADINHRGNNSTRCEPCQHEHKLALNREHKRRARRLASAKS